MNKQQIEQMFAHSWPLQDVLNKLIEAAEILLDKKDYDGHGWEEISHCVKQGKVLVPIIQQLAQDAGKESEGEAPSGEGEIKKAMLQLKGLYKGEGEKMAEDWEKMVELSPNLIYLNSTDFKAAEVLYRKLRKQLEAGKAPESAALIPTDEELEDMVMDGYAKTDKNKERVRVAKVVRDRIAERFKTIQSNK